MESRDVIEEYLAAIETVRAAFGDMSRELLFARPVAGKWSSQEVLCHLVDTDLTVALRIRAALTRDCPRLQTATREEITTGLAVDARDATEELTLFQTIRCETARIVRTLLPNALHRQAVLVPANGAETTRTVQQFLTGITKHVAHHLAFVYEKRRALGLARTFSTRPSTSATGTWPSGSAGRGRGRWPAGRRPSGSRTASGSRPRTPNWSAGTGRSGPI